jgi:MscS family membrane protein
MILDRIPLFEELSDPAKALIARVLFFFFVVILIILLRHLLTFIMVRPLRRLAKRTGFRQDDEIIKAMMTPLRLVVIAIAIFISASVFRVGDSLDLFFINVGRSFIIFAIFTAAYQFIDLVAPSSRQLARVTGLEIEDRLLPFMRTAIKIVIIALGMVVLLQEWDYDVSGLIAGFGLGGLAFSLAAQDTASNLFGFMAIVSDNPFQVGEYIIMPDAEGIVEHVGMRTTRIRQLDQAIVYVPNSSMANSPITNWSRLSKRRLDYTLGVTYDTTSGDMRVLVHRIRDLLKVQELVDPDSVTVYFMSFGDSALNILVRCYISIQDWAEFQAEKERLNLLIMDMVDELNLGIAFPSMSLYVENLPPVTVPEERPRPRLTREERALQGGRAEKDSDNVKVNEQDENVTGQQDEGD